MFTLSFSYLMLISTLTYLSMYLSIIYYLLLAEVKALGESDRPVQSFLKLCWWEPVSYSVQMPGSMAASSVPMETLALLKFKLISYCHLPVELQGFLQLISRRGLLGEWSLLRNSLVYFHRRSRLKTDPVEPQHRISWRTKGVKNSFVRFCCCCCFKLTYV